MRHKKWIFKLAIICLLIIIMLIMGACGGDRASSDSNATSGDSSSDAQAPPVATMPPAQFTAVAEQAVTNTKALSLTTTQTQTTQASADDLARGARSYAKNKCNGCHGEKGEVVAGKTTKVIAGTTLSATQFDQFLRTGGGQGNVHIFGPSAISPGGMETLYVFVKSLPGK